jgi:hypothetical protein
MPQGDLNAKGFVSFDNSQGYDWDAFPPISWFNRWKQISSFQLDQSGFFPWKKIFWVGFFLNFFGGVSFKKIALRLGNWKSICAQSNKRIECLFGVLYSVLKKGFISKYDIYIYQGNKFLGKSKCNFFKTHFCDSSCNQKAMSEREREREREPYILWRWATPNLKTQWSKTFACQTEPWVWHG